MAKQLSDLQAIAKAEISDEDLIWIRDVSQIRDKKAKVGDVFGRPLEGWLSVVTDTWTYSSYDAQKKVGVISVNAGATARYAIGQRLQFKQSNTLKYAIIIAQTDTSLTVLMLNNAELANEAFDEIKYSQSFAPQTVSGINFFGTLMTGQVEGKPVLFTAIQEGDNDVAPQQGYVILEAIIGDDV